MPFETGAQVGRYRVVRLIAQGGMAEVYQAEQEMSAGFFRQVALKIIRPEYSESKDFRAMFLDEARTACGLSHPNIVPIYEVDEADGSLFMAMELVPGETLARVGRLMREAGKLFNAEALLAIGIHTCAALEAVHALRMPGEGHVNLVHRDVSPHNLLLSPQGNLKLIDFGIAKAVTNRNLTMPGVTKGKAGYFSPEQAMGLPLDGRSDLFSVGITLYKLAYGNTPFDDHETVDARNTALLGGEWKPLREVCAGLPEGLHAVVDKALQVKAQDRFASATEMREALERVAVENGMHVGPSSLAGYVKLDAEDSAVVSSTSRVESGGEAPSVQLGDGPAPRPAMPPPPPMDEVVGDATMVLKRPAEAAGDRTPEGEAPPWLLGVAVGLGAAVVGAASVLLLFGRNVQPAPVAPPAPAAPVAAVAPAAPKPVPVVVAPAAEPVPPASPVDVAEPRVTAPPRPGPAAVQSPPPKPVALAQPPPAAPVEPKPEVKQEPKPEPRPEPKPAPVVVAPAAAKEESIPAGKGKLRIGSSPDGLKVKVAGFEGSTPLQFELASGRYAVEFLSADGSRGECKNVKVLPDATAKLKYDADAKRCE
jgi:serine/threonine protein kinase